MACSKKKSTALVLFGLLLVASIVSNSGAEGGTIYIYFVETNKTSYEIGENINATAAWFIDYGNGPQFSEAVMSLLGGDRIAYSEWLNEAQGYHVHQTLFLLDPIDWNPGRTGIDGAVEVSLCLTLESGYLVQKRSFTISRAGQNCSLIRIVPTQPSANDSLVSLFLRVYNRNNSSFGVSSGSVYYNITDPYNNNIAVNSNSVTGNDGNFTIAFTPNYRFGSYQLSLRSCENDKYLEGRFVFTLTVSRSSVPTIVNSTWNYTGRAFNSTNSYPLEPVEVTAKLISSINGTGINSQEITMRILDSESLRPVSQMKELTNDSGFATCIFIIPYAGKFVIESSYDGLPNTWLPSFQKSIELVKAIPRELNALEVVGLPLVINPDNTYHIKYALVDAFTRVPVSNISIAVKLNDLLLASGTTDNDGVVQFEISVPHNKWNLSGNQTLFVDAFPEQTRGIYGNSSFSKTLFFKPSTIMLLDAYPKDVVEDSETLSISAQLLSLDFTPISSEHMTFTIFMNRATYPMNIITAETDNEGVCRISLRLSEPGVLTIAVNFNGSLILDPSNATYSILVLPSSQERFATSVSTIVLTNVTLVIALLIARKSKRKVKWRDIALL